MNIIKGIMIDCNTNESTVVNLEYEIISIDNLRVFKLINGVTGYEDFYIDNYDGKVRLNTINRMRKSGWRACVGTRGVWNELIIPGEEMTKALDGVK
jgi:hypothetical protein